MIEGELRGRIIFEPLGIAEIEAFKDVDKEIINVDSAMKLQELVKERIRIIKTVEDKDTLYSGHISLLQEMDNLQTLVKESEK